VTCDLWLLLLLMILSDLHLLLCTQLKRMRSFAFFYFFGCIAVIDVCMSVCLSVWCLNITMCVMYGCIYEYMYVCMVYDDGVVSN